MPTNPWSDMTPAERNAALAEKLGWSTIGIDEVILKWNVPGRGEFDASDYSPRTWSGMGLVVEAMAARGWAWDGGLYDGKAAAVFRNGIKVVGLREVNMTVPEATAEAAWRALTGGVNP